MKYSTEMMLIKAFCIVVAIGGVNSILLGVLGVVSYFMAG
jgi:hypothetical protein